MIEKYSIVVRFTSKFMDIIAQSLLICLSNENVCMVGASFNQCKSLTVYVIIKIQSSLDYPPLLGLVKMWVDSEDGG